MKTLDAFDRWCVRSNLARIASGEATAEETVQTLRANGYPSVADAVERAVADGYADTRWQTWGR